MAKRKTKNRVLKIYHATHIRKVDGLEPVKTEVVVASTKKKFAVESVKKEYGDGEVIISRLPIARNFAQTLANAANAPTINHGV